MSGWEIVESNSGCPTTVFAHKSNISVNPGVGCRRQTKVERIQMITRREMLATTAGTLLSGS
jgi:hypothetical protein